MTSRYAPCDLRPLLVTDSLQRAAGHGREDVRGRAFAHLLSLITERTARLAFLPRTHAVDKLRLVWRGRRGAESHCLC